MFVYYEIRGKFNDIPYLTGQRREKKEEMNTVSSNQ